MGCPVCVHPQIDEINANRAHLSLRQLERTYHVSRSSLGRHVQRCRQPSQPSGDTGEPTRAPVPAHHPLAVYHGEAVQLHQMLATPGQPVDLRQGLTAVVALLVKMTEPDSRLK